MIVTAPGDAGYLCEAVRKYGSVEKERLGIAEQQEEQNILKHCSKHWHSPTQTHLAGKQDVKYYQSWAT